MPVWNKTEPLSEQQGTKFLPPKKEQQELFDVGKKESKEKQDTRKKGINKNNSSIKKARIETARNNPPNTKPTKKQKATKSEERKKDFENFKEKLGVGNKELVLSFISQAIEEIDTVKMKLEDLKVKVSKEIK